VGKDGWEKDAVYLSPSRRECVGRIDEGVSGNRGRREGGVHTRGVLSPSSDCATMFRMSLDRRGITCSGRLFFLSRAFLSLSTYEGRVGGVVYAGGRVGG
jgi:hypothetical protein